MVRHGMREAVELIHARRSSTTQTSKLHLMRSVPHWEPPAVRPAKYISIQTSDVGWLVRVKKRPDNSSALESSIRTSCCRRLPRSMTGVFKEFAVAGRSRKQVPRY